VTKAPLLTPGLSGPLNGVAQMQASSFGPGAWFLDKQARADLALYYGFCRAIDDCADEYKPAEAKRHLAAWKKELAALHKGRPGTPMGLALAELCVRRGIPAGLMDDLWLGAASDAKPAVRLKRYHDVRAYCYRVAGSVGIACLPIFGLPLEGATPFALALGEAFQLINIVRDAREDAQRGRLYFALEDLKAHGVSPAAWMAGQGGEPAQALLRDYAGRARHALERADAAMVGLDGKALRAPRLMRALYGGLLDRMQADGLKVFEKRYRLGKARKLWILAKAVVAG
jgi:phytoene synthase